MNEIITIFIIQTGFKYTGILIKENEQFISIFDDKEQKQIDFPKAHIIIKREVKNGNLF